MFAGCYTASHHAANLWKKPARPMCAHRFALLYVVICLLSSSTVIFDTIAVMVSLLVIWVHLQCAGLYLILREEHHMYILGAAWFVPQRNPLRPQVSFIPVYTCTETQVQSHNRVPGRSGVQLQTNCVLHLRCWRTVVEPTVSPLKKNSQ